LALCEVANDPSLKDHGWAHTLGNENACICRFLLVNGEFNIDTLNTTKLKVPRLKDILDSQADTVEEGRKD
jgi:hypothetical protein